MSLSVESATSNVAEYTVSEISGALKRTVEDAFGHVRVRGEISGYRGPHSSGHAYFCLKDDKARIDAVVWRTAFVKLGFKPEEGLEVIATGRLTTFPGSSKYQIVIETIEPAGAGALMALLAERKRRLEGEGLFAPERKRALPFLPRVIGVVTSPTGAVIRDIHHRIADRFPVHILVWPVRVQGETSGAEVSEAIAGFNAIEAGGAIPRPDVIIVARGGGSLEDLWGFNDEAVVRAAASSAIPLISAVGHETDWTLIDHAADRRAPTPTGAAEMAVPVRADLLANLANLHARHAGAISRRLEQERRAVTATARALPTPDMLLALPRRRLDEATTSLGQCLRVAVGDKRRAYGEIASRLTPSSLESLLREKRADLRHHESHAAHAVQALVVARRQRFDRVAAHLQPHMIRARSEAARLRLDAFGERLAVAAARSADARRQRLAAAWRVATSLDPRRVLERGYAIIRGPGDVPIVRADSLAPGMHFEVEFAGRERRSAVATGEGEAIPATPAPQRPKPRAPRRSPDAGGQGDLF
ncbi:exodeoxyribonuclease VII large subunit [Aurantimonas sp. HBX-1]|uniref:exodeoxyribonuclease VII large subunit n=1 Tax=Aurantimonas sp. HBX-1 TaxID=2906072 RepID=UPI001F1C4488|nr:exodeoxyribonuclease VII large subunit [Aurantimonas sp. HBX-1]UIJ71303.1 exodeoxyribonuclease VII large subunit [Aurantimonas sp. HBX-1]